MKKLTLTLAAVLISGTAMASEELTWKDYDGYDDLLFDFTYEDRGVVRGHAVDIDAATHLLTEGNTDHLDYSERHEGLPSDFMLDKEGIADVTLDGDSEDLNI